jgi:TolB-like protein/tetratricopeptide (TPR) repeat protein/tRNA A-37 threonylcarbamoyl transferase component Bud32
MTDPLTALRTTLADRYRVERKIAAGGMATVYLAHDLRHSRSVALKVLDREIMSSLATERFLAEIKTTARLHHPHILQLHDSGDAAGYLFFVMPLVEGESLRDRLDVEPRLPVDEALRIACEVGDGLAYAHARGIIHRDIKPANIMLASGHALVADFGIARAMSTTGEFSVTLAGQTLGTVAYMSPEQSVGDDTIDARSDIYSLACVLYEMLAGEPPFFGGGARDIIRRRMTTVPAGVRTKRPDVPRRIEAALQRAMAVDPADRFATVEELVAALSAGNAPADDDASKTLAVLPFANVSADAEGEAFSDGISDEILGAMVRVRGLRVIARTSSFAFKGKDVDVREIGRRLGAGLVLEGSVRKSGAQLRITAQLIDTMAGTHLWSERYDREMKDVFDVQDDITAAIRDALSARVLGLGQLGRPAEPQIDPETYELFLRGKFLIAKPPDGMKRGMEYLQQVVQRAPLYAPAYGELAGAHGVLTFWGALAPRVGWPQVRALAQRALELDPSLAGAYVELGSLALYFEYNWKEALRLFERALALAPTHALCLAHLAFLRSSLNQPDEGVRLAVRAVSLDPLNPRIRFTNAYVHYLVREYEQSVALCDQMIELDPSFSEAHRIKGQSLLALGRLDEAMPSLENAVRLSSRNPYPLCVLARLHGAAGRLDEARAILRELIDRSATEPVPPAALALGHLGVGDRDAFFTWIERAYEARNHWLISLRAGADFDPVRGDPRFQALLDRVGVPDPGAVAAPPFSLGLSGSNAVVQ